MSLQELPNRSRASTVRAAVTTAPGTLEIRDIPLPDETAPGGLLKVAVTGVCGSDWEFFQTCPKMRGPVILGHETVGWIDRAERASLERWGLKEGDLVALEEYVPCTHCAACRSGEFRSCEATNWRSGGLRYGATELARSPALWGGYAEIQYLHPNTVFHRVPSGLDPKYAALALPVANGIEWTHLQGRAGPGETVLIQGPGQQGLSCVAAAKEAGASKIIVTGLSTPNDRARLEMAKLLGADYTIEVDNTDPIAAVTEITGGQMADLVLDCAGVPASFLASFYLVRRHGRVVLGGHMKHPVASFDSNRIVNLYLTVKGVRGHSYQAVEHALAMLAADRHNLRRLSTNTFSLAETETALNCLVGKGVAGAIHCTVDPMR
jgi:threonine dehydrogenase-like Zn-dependent dehydrogenase